MATTTIKSTELDFDTIKSNLKTFLAQQSEFTDYDFEGSGLSSLLDVLSYNTHFNGLLANFALNESFLSSSQLRSSVVSHAETLGYRTRSITSAIAVVNLSAVVPSGGSTPALVTMPAGSQIFSSTIGGVTFNFQTTEVLTASPETDSTTGNTTYNFKKSSSLSSSTDTNQNTVTNIELKEGVSGTKTFFVGKTSDNQVYVIPEKNIDTSTIVVKVFDTASSSESTTYSDIKNVTRLTTSTTVYNIQETPNGFYEILFGNDTGIIPVAGNKIEVTFLKSNGADANGGSTFTSNSTISIGGSARTLSASVVSKSAGGSSKQTIDSIKTLAPLMYASQQRLVTADDYRTQILNKFASTVKDVNAYGGEDSNPPEFGKVLVSLNFFDDISEESKTTIKDQIVADLSNNLSIMSITTKFVDPTNVFLELTTTYNLNPNLTSKSSSAIELDISNQITTFFNNNLKTFNKTFRRSNLLTDIDDLDDAILNSRMDVKVQMRISSDTDPSILLGTSKDYTLTFPMKISKEDDENFIVTTSTFTFNGKECSIRNKLSSKILQIISADGVEVDNIGSYDEGGILTLNGFAPTALAGSVLKVSVVPANQSTVRPLLNYILDIDDSLSTVTTILDFDNIRLTL